MPCDDCSRQDDCPPCVNGDDEPLSARPACMHRWHWQHAYEWQMDLATLEIREACVCGAVHQRWGIDDRG